MAGPGLVQADVASMAEESLMEQKLVEVDDLPVSGSRKRWMFLVWTLTFWIPDFLVRYLGRMKRKDVRIVWREKVAINMLIWLSCLFVAFFIGELIDSST